MQTITLEANGKTFELPVPGIPQWELIEGWFSQYQSFRYKTILGARCAHSWFEQVVQSGALTSSEAQDFHELAAIEWLAFIRELEAA